MYKGMGLVDPALLALRDALHRAVSALANADFHTTWVDEASPGHKSVEFLHQQIGLRKGEVDELLIMVDEYVQRAEREADAAD
jgi:predicted RNA-binding protein with EMAP domain